MTFLKKRVVMFLAAVTASLFLVELGWMRAGSFFGLALASMAGIWAVAWSLKPNPSTPWPHPEVEVPIDYQVSIAPSRAGLAMTILGLIFLGLAFFFALRNQLFWTLAMVVMAAACWRPLINLRPDPALSRRWLAILMLLIMATGAAFRFYKAGDIPAGLITVDEPRLIATAHDILFGKRESFHVDGSEGNAPFWIEAASQWLFGNDITGFRMSALLPGFMVVGLIGLLALELAGSRIGLISAAFCALCVWPVAFSRAEYLVCSSFVPILAAPWLLMRGLRRGSPLSLTASGFFLGLAFNIYNPAKLVPIFALLLCAYLWMQRREWRPALRWAVLPLLGGAIVGLAPLLLWAARDPSFACASYFGKINIGFIVGPDVMQTHGFFPKLDMTFGRILPNLPRLITMFTTHGGMRPWYFKLDQPIIDRATLFFLMAGMAAALVRFRQPAFALLLAWWLLGLMPTLLAAPGVQMDERRIMLNMPATLMLAGLGFYTCVKLITRDLSHRLADKVLVITSLIFFIFLGINSWRTYFYDINLDRGFQDYNHANFDNMSRAIFIQEHRSPVSVISFRKPNIDNWWGALFDNDLVDHWGILQPIPRYTAATDEGYFSSGGLFGLLRQAATTSSVRDPLIVLTPFHFYLEPLLVEHLGGVRVTDVPPVMAKDGPNYTDVGFAWDKDTATRLVRLKDFSPSKLDALQARWNFPYTVEEVTPPSKIGTRKSLNDIWLLDPINIKALKSYDAQPQGWRAGKAIQFSLPDAWFWLTAHNFPGHPDTPLRLKASWTLLIPLDGEYRLGASATAYTALRVDGRKVFTLLVETREQHEGAREGYLSQPIFLKAGSHRLDVEEMILNFNGNFNHVIRLLWQKPGGIKETLPLEALLPQPPK